MDSFNFPKGGGLLGATARQIAHEHYKKQKENEMSNTKHTPGAWRILRTPIAGRSVRFTVETETVADLALVGTPHETGVCLAETEANARLIAAAPCLLLALQEVCREHSATCHCVNCELISKATGEK